MVSSASDGAPSGSEGPIVCIALARGSFAHGGGLDYSAFIPMGLRPGPGAEGRTAPDGWRRIGVGLVRNDWEIVVEVNDSCIRVKQSGLASSARTCKSEVRPPFLKLL